MCAHWSYNYCYSIETTFNRGEKHVNKNVLLLYTDWKQSKKVGWVYPGVNCEKKKVIIIIFKTEGDCEHGKFISTLSVCIMQIIIVLFVAV